MNNTLKSACIAGMAALAMAVSPAAFAQGKGNGNGKGGGGGPPAAKANGNGGGNPGRGGGNAGNRGGPPSAARGGGNRGGGNGNAGNRGGGNRVVGNRGGGNRNAGNRGGGNRDFDIRGGGNRFDRGGGPIRVRNRDGIDIDVGFALPDLRRTLFRDNRLIGGCPPGLARKGTGCLPPGQARQRYRSFDAGFFGLGGLGGGRYFYNDGYLLSYGRGGLSGYIPLLGGALTIGNSWPGFYEPRPLPGYYQSYYGLGDPRGYRFADNVVYRVDPETAAITSVAALLTGNDFAIGQPVPRGYDAYNVPYRYRDTYFDGPGARYRYSDGYIYEIDPETALVVAAIDLVA